jgi:hypothetical protein
VSRYERTWYNAGRLAARAGLTSLPPRGLFTKKRRAYLAGYAQGNHERLARLGLA